MTTVLSDRYTWGLVRPFDERALVAVPAGATYVAPAEEPHFVWANEGDAIYREMGAGPTGTVLTRRKARSCGQRGQ